MTVKMDDILDFGFCGYVKMWIIDFDDSIDWNQRDKISKNEWEYESKCIDILMLMDKLVRDVLLIACSNKPLYDELLPYIRNIDFFMAESERNLSENKWSNVNEDAIELLNKIKAKVDTLREPAWNEYIDVVIAPTKIPLRLQKMKATGRFENSLMGKEDNLYTYSKS